MSDPMQQRYKYFADQNVEEGHFDVTFQFGTNNQHSDGTSPGNNITEPIQELHAHKFELWPSSKVFEKTFFGPLANKGPIPIVRHSYNDFKEFLTFLYLGKCDITMDNVMALVDLGEYYEVQLLKDECDKFLTQNSTKIENVLKVYESLKVYSLENAMKKVMEFVAKNTVNILKSNEFLSAKKETIFDIAKMTNLTAKQEEVFEAICKWNEHNCPEETVEKNDFLKKQMKDIIPLIDFSSMDFNFLHNFVVRKGFLFPNFDGLADALCEAAAKKQQAKEERLNIVPERKRVEIIDGDGRKAYADICDPLIIAALETMISNETPQLTSQTRYGGIQWNANIGQQSVNTSNLCLFRDPCGYLSLKYYGPHKTNPSKICCHNYEEDYTYSYEEERSICEGCYLRSREESAEPPIIAPVFIESDRFTPDYRCTMKFL